MTGWAYLFAGLALLCATLGLIATVRMMHAQADSARLRAQIGEERIAAADEQRSMIAVATAECGHDVAWKMLSAAASRRSYEVARELLEDVSP